MKPISERFPDSESNSLGYDEPALPDGPLLGMAFLLWWGIGGMLGAYSRRREARTTGIPRTSQLSDSSFRRSSEILLDDTITSSTFVLLNQLRQCEPRDDQITC